MLTRSLIAMMTLLAGTMIGTAGIEGPTIYMIGDSTMADKPMNIPQPERGWGQLFKEYVRPPATVSNHAMNGRSTKSFIRELRWDYVRERLKEGDYVIIEFGHNDEKTNMPDTGTDPQTEFRSNLVKFIREAKEKGATPILATPICRRRFTDQGAWADTHGVYPSVTRSVAAEQNVALLDLEEATKNLLQTFGPEKSKALFLWISPGQYPSLPNGRKDDTHLSEYGSRWVCQLAIKAIREQHLSLEKWIQADFQTVN